MNETVLDETRVMDLEPLPPGVAHRLGGFSDGDPTVAASRKSLVRAISLRVRACAEYARRLALK